MGNAGIDVKGAQGNGPDPDQKTVDIAVLETVPVGPRGKSGKDLVFEVVDGKHEHAKGGMSRLEPPCHVEPRHPRKADIHDHHIWKSPSARSQKEIQRVLSAFSLPRDLDLICPGKGREEPLSHKKMVLHKEYSDHKRLRMGRSTTNWLPGSPGR